MSNNSIAIKKDNASKMKRSLRVRIPRRIPAKAGPNKKARYPLDVSKEFTLTNLFFEKFSATKALNAGGKRVPKLLDKSQQTKQHDVFYAIKQHNWDYHYSNCLAGVCKNHEMKTVKSV